MNTPNTFIEQFKTFVQSVRMQPRVRDVVRERLIAYADLHGVRTVATIIDTMSFWTRLNAGLMRAGFAAVLLLISTGGIAFASEHALPGDTLYDVKVGLVEPLETSLLVSPKTRATWSAILAERRLTEAATLAIRDELSNPTRTYIEQEFLTHVEEADRSIDEIEASGDIESALAVRSDLEARLSAHADLFAFIADFDEDGKPEDEAGKLHNAIALRRDTVAGERMRTEEIAYERGLAYQNAQIDAAASATEEVSRIARESGGEAVTGIEDRITAARGALDIARGALAREEDGGAYIATQAATRLTHEAAILSKNKDIIIAADVAHGKKSDDASAVLSAPVSLPAEATSTDEDDSDHQSSNESSHADAASYETQVHADEPTLHIDFGGLNIGL